MKWKNLTEKEINTHKGETRHTSYTEIGFSELYEGEKEGWTCNFCNQLYAEGYAEGFRNGIIEVIGGIKDFLPLYLNKFNIDI